MEPISQELQDFIDELPSDGQWWKSASRESFITVAQQLKQAGLSDEVIKETLETLYHAVKAEYGD